jgi:bifunctional non-homologous end joining protein LigD
LSGRGAYWGVVRALRFVVQLHDATRLHYDFRIQSGEVLRSWAVPKGPSLDPRVRRLAVPVEDHAMSAGDFEGVHDGHVRGTGAVIVWDEGIAEIVRDEPGYLSFVLHGRKLSGRFALTRTGGSAGFWSRPATRTPGRARTSPRSSQRVC